MDPNRKSPAAVYAAAGVAVIGLIGVFYWQIKAGEQRKTDARALCEEWATELDARTTPVGEYVRHDGDELPAADPWGTPLRVTYSSGGLAEKVEVRSAGPDRQAFTKDDIVSFRLAANSRNIARGTLEAAGDLAKEKAKSATEGMKDKLGFGKKKGD